MSLSAKREHLARLHARYRRIGRRYKSRLPDEFRATCGYHRRAALWFLNRPPPTAPPRRSDPKTPAQLRPVLKDLWLASDQLCSKLLKAALPGWLDHYQRHAAPHPAASLHRFANPSLRKCHWRRHLLRSRRKPSRPAPTITNVYRTPKPDGTDFYKLGTMHDLSLAGA